MLAMRAMPGSTRFCRFMGSPNLLRQRPLLCRRGLRAVCLNVLQRGGGCVKFPAGCLGIFRQRWIVGPWHFLPDPDQEGPLRLTNDAGAAASSSSTLVPMSKCHKNAPHLLTKFLQPAQLQRRQAKPSLAQAPQMTPPKTRQRTPRKLQPLLQLRLLMPRPLQTRPESWRADQPTFLHPQKWNETTKVWTARMRPTARLGSRARTRQALQRMISQLQRRVGPDTH